MALLIILGIVIVFSFALWLSSKLERRKFLAACQEFDELKAKYGYLGALDRCPHKVITIGQSGTPGVITTTIKWCKICGGYVGAAKLRESIFGNKWE
jgi:hypothetical protein